MVSTRSSKNKQGAPTIAATEELNRGVRRKTPNQFSLPSGDSTPVRSSVARPVKNPRSRASQVAPALGNNPDEDSNTGIEENFETKSREIQRILDIDIREIESYYEIFNIRKPDDSLDLASLVKWQGEVIEKLYSLGALLHPRFTNVDNASLAFEKLLDAAERLGADEWRTAEIREWDGESDLNGDVEDEDMFDDDDEDDEEGLPAEDQLPEPPVDVQLVYKEACSHMTVFMHAPADMSSIDSINQLNYRILRLAKDDLEKIQQYRKWMINLNFFGVHFEAAQTAYSKLQGGSEATVSAAKVDIETIRSLIKIQNKRCHYPQEWNILSVEDYLSCTAIGNEAGVIVAQGEKLTNGSSEQMRKMMYASESMNTNDSERYQAVLGIHSEARTHHTMLVAHHQVSKQLFIVIKWANSVTVAQDSLEVIQSHAIKIQEATQKVHSLVQEALHVINGGELSRSSVRSNIINPPSNINNSGLKYTWKTFPLDSETEILAWNHRGRGKQVLTARKEEDGRTVHRIEPASEVDPQIAEEMSQDNKALNLKQAQTMVSRQDRQHFVEIHWCTKSLTKVRNTAAGKKDPDAVCCIQFQSGYHLLGMATVFKVLGKGQSTFDKIKAVCERDGFCPPWEAEPVATKYDLAALKKDPKTRRMWRESAATEASVLKSNVTSQGYTAPKLPVSSQQQTQRPTNAVIEQGLFLHDNPSQQRMDNLEQQIQELKAMMQTLIQNIPAN
ncbi:hypothetical protein ACHAP4_011303 [Fusarium culmorum]